MQYEIEAAEANRHAKEAGHKFVTDYISKCRENTAMDDTDILIELVTGVLDLDDGWSGRGNDAKRSHYDGRAESVKRFAFALDRKRWDSKK